MMRLGIALLAAALALPAAAQAPASHAMAAPKGSGFYLAGLRLPEAQLQSAIKKAWQVQLADRPELRAIMAKDPGFVGAVWVAAEPELQALPARELPGLREEVGALFEKRLTPGNLHAIIAVDELATGQRILALNVDSFGYPAAERDARYETQMRRIIAGVSTADNALMRRAGPSMSKLDPLSVEMNAAIAARMARIMTEAEPRLREVMEKAGRAYMASKEPKQ